jgi:hypothetical protein
MNEVNRLNHLIESLVELSNINTCEKINKIDINDEIELIIKDFRNDADKKDININYINQNPKNLIINKQHFYILFSNLL